MLNKVLGWTGYQLTKKTKNTLPPDFDKSVLSIIEKVQPFTMTSNERLSALVQSVHYTLDNKIEGAFVECGVWKGGSMMAAALTLMQRGETVRELYLYDTFAGMPPAGEADKDFEGKDANDLLEQDKNKKEESVVWAYSGLDEVKANLGSVGYPSEKIHFIEGKVEDTIPQQVPEKIALLRLDTDWYESTKHELQHLFPRLQKNGILIIDDYGFWKGARKAVDEFLSGLPHHYYLHRIDDTGRLLIKITD
jgi:O-methyltransferase